MISAETSTIESREDIPVNAVLEMFHKWYYIEEDYSILGPIAFVISNYLPGDHDVCFLVGPSGSTKTTTLRSFGETANDFVYPVSSITEKTLVSGLPESKDLIPRLNGRAVIIKDFTSIASKKDDSQAQIFADIREITDGYIKKEFGNGVIKEYHGINSSFLCACTNIIERQYSMHSQLGQRAIFMRPRNDPVEARKRATQNRGHEDVIRSEIHEVMIKFIREMHARIDIGMLPTVPDWFDEKMGSLYDFLAIVRTQIHKDFHGNIDEIPEPEFPTRIAMTLTKLCEIHGLIFGRSELNESDYNFGKRIILDNVPTQRLQLLKVIGDEWSSTASLAKMARLPTASSKRILDELQALGIVDRLPKGDRDGSYFDGRSDSYRIVPDFKEVISQLIAM